MPTDDIKVVITAEDKASGVLSKVGNSVKSMGGMFASFAKVGGAAALAGLTALGGAAILVGKEFADAQGPIAQLDAVLKSTAGAAGVTRDAVLKLSTSLQNQTTFSDETITSAQNLLLTFTKISKDVFPDATKTVLDMSAALGQDTKSSAIQLGKALNDPIEGVTALRRVGVSFNETQLQTIKSLVETGKTLDAQKLILKELATEFGGSASAQAETFGGKITQLKNILGDLMETVGEPLIGALIPAIDKFKEWATSVTVQEKINELVNVLKAFIEFVSQDLPSGIQSAISSINEFIQKMLENVVVQAILYELKNAFDQVWDAIQNNLMPALQEFWNTMQPIMPTLIEFGQVFAKVMGTILLGALIAVIKILTVVLVGLTDLLSAMIKVNTFITDIAIKAWDAFTTKLAQVITFFQQIVEWAAKVKDAIASAMTSFSSVSGKVLSAPGKLLGFADGGVVPGPLGAPVPAIVHGGETVIPAGQGFGGGVNIYISGNSFLDDDAPNKMANKIMDVLKMNLRI